MVKYEKRVNDRIGKVINTQAAYTGFVSFDFNTGAIVSGSVDNKLLSGDLDGALRVLNMYVNAGGRRMNGLVKRRKEETNLIRHGRYPVRKILVRDRPGSKPRYLHKSQIPWNEYPIGKLSPVLPRKNPETPVKSENFILDLMKLIWKAFNNAKKTC